ncbi:type IV toxin-antitoxin system AbiEi family antitoxin domain-containing protein [Cellulomonas sp. zg-ZUI222]|uniref:type IV toxin-antitoxin system AbiEi family antitoxin domain-containing protein n=1 Tax=Cellulomonas TaxID=1707 RepID=UPI001A94EBE7|nr:MULTISPECIES: type IV toxin-antitoxin system AbiEi family antitoxin [Cellulomonas]MBO0901882.1 type IV toxin-antitoxin system AbiEi family antitoxin domain-containing protein [Cellulomonas sp. zg-ZUI22]MBO0922121.1 type IV toxin-antitoxin system AbiEi family antitoxin domain-containing protein [Cellulomonas wangleii]
MSGREEIARLAARAPLRTIRVADLAHVYAHPKKEIRELRLRGVLHRLARGIYCAVPLDVDAATWRPTLEAATAAVATAHVGDRVPVLMGLTAARVHRALPRAVGEGHVAVPTYRRPTVLADRDARVVFTERDVSALDAVLVPTDLGPALATTPEQTVLDLARTDPRGHDVDAQEAIDALWPACDPAQLQDLAEHQRMRATLRRLEARR